MRRLPLAVLGFTLLAGSIPAQRMAQDRAAFVAARAVTDPGERVKALLAFAAAYPGTGLAGEAANLALNTDLANFPERTPEIHALAAADVAGTPAGFERWSEESRIADLLAGAGPAGADLPDAKTWAAEAAAALTEESYHHQMLAMGAKYKLEAQTPKGAHHDFLLYRGAFLAALANVQVREGDLEAAGRTLAEARRAAPLSSEVSSLEGQLALARAASQGPAAKTAAQREALADFERAEAEGDLPERWRGEMMSLYKEVNGPGADAAGALDDEIDAVYARLFPPLYSLPPRRLPAGGHAALLELFSGTGCQPCVAPDLAVESLLGTYSRDDLVVLEYDENIPRPDPLTNPDSVARATTYRVDNTPEAFLDGEELPVMGASRADVENVVVGFAEAIEDRAAEPTGVRLGLSATQGEGGAIEVSAKVSSVAVTAAAAADPVPPLPSHPAVYFALVQDDVRYSGENGVRFHRMVVRATARESGPDLRTNAAGEVTTSFNPPEIARDQLLYLNAYERRNDRFGAVHFLTKDLRMDPRRLAVVAWVEDSKTGEVLGAAYAPVPVK